MEGKRSQRPAVWLAGESEHQDFAAAVAWLREQFDCASCRELERAGNAPSAIVFCQSRPGSISSREVDALHRAAPLARLILLTGPWCDGEIRSGRIAPGVIRIRWHESRVRLQVELDFRRSCLPRTATEGERLERQLRRLAHSPRPAGRAAICTLSRAKYEVLAAACAALGWQATWLSSPDRIAASDCDLVLIDGWECLAGVPPNCPLPRLLLLGFSRPEDCQRAMDHGIAAVIAEPHSLPSLAAALAAAAPPSLHQSVA